MIVWYKKQKKNAYIYNFGMFVFILKDNSFQSVLN